MLDVDDLLVCLIMEDQNIRSQAMLELMNAPDPSQLPFEPHTAFLPAEVGARLLAEIQDASPHRQPVPTSANMAISPALSLVLGVANDLQQKLQSKQVTPLHLLAAVLAGSTNGVLSLRGCRNHPRNGYRCNSKRRGALVPRHRFFCDFEEGATIRVKLDGWSKPRLFALPARTGMCSLQIHETRSWDENNRGLNVLNIRFPRLVGRHLGEHRGRLDPKAMSSTNLTMPE